MYLSFVDLAIKFSIYLKTYDSWNVIKYEEYGMGRWGGATTADIYLYIERNHKNKIYRTNFYCIVA